MKNGKLKLLAGFLLAALLSCLFVLFFFTRYTSEKPNNVIELVGKSLTKDFSTLITDYQVTTSEYFSDTTAKLILSHKKEPTNSFVKSNKKTQFMLLNGRGSLIDWTFVRSDLLKEIRLNYVGKNKNNFIITTPDAEYLVSVRTIQENHQVLGVLISYWVLDYKNTYIPSTAVPESYTAYLTRKYHFPDVPDISFSSIQKGNNNLTNLPVSILNHDSLFVQVTVNQFSDIVISDSSQMVRWISFLSLIVLLAFIVTLNLYLGTINFSKNKILTINIMLGLFVLMFSYFLKLEIFWFPIEMTRYLQHLANLTYNTLTSFSDLTYLAASVLFCSTVFMAFKIQPDQNKINKFQFYFWFLFSAFFLSLIYNFTVIILQSLQFDGLITPIPINLSFDSVNSFILLVLSGLIAGFYLFLIFTYKAYRLYRVKNVLVVDYILLGILGWLGFIPITYFLTKPTEQIWYFLLLAYFLHFVAIVVAQRKEYRFKFSTRTYLPYTFLLFQAFIPIFLIYISSTDDRLNSIQQNTAPALLNPKDGFINYVAGETVTIVRQDTTLINKITNLNEIEDYSYSVWLGSLLSREKLSTRIRLYDSKLQLVSEWSFGSVPLVDQKTDSLLLEYVRKENSGSNKIKMITQNDKNDNYQFSRYTTLLTNSSDSVYAIFSIDMVNPKIASQNENPLLITTDENYLPTYNFEIAIYQQGKRAEDLIAGYFPQTLTEEISKNLTKSKTYWTDITYNDNPIRIFYYQSGGIKNKVIAVSRPLMNMSHWWNTLAEYFIYILLAFCVIYFFVHFIGFVKYGRVVISFKERVFSGLLLSSFFAFWLLLFLFSRTFKEHGISTSKVLLDNYYQGMSSKIIEQVEESNYAVSKSSQDYIIYKNGVLSYTSRPEWIRLNLMPDWLPNNLYRNLVTSSVASVYGEYTVGTVDFLVGYYQLKNQKNENITIAIPNLISKRTIESEINSAKSYLISGYVFFLILFVFLLSLWANWLLRPIQIIEKAFRKIGRQKEPQPLSIKGIPEIEQFADSFNLMVNDLHRYRENLTKAERQLAWQEMAKQVAHEIKNPLTPLKLNIQILLNQYRNDRKIFDDNFDKTMNRISNEVDKIDKIAKTFSTFSKMPERAEEPFIPDDVIEDVCGLYAVENANIKTHISGVPCYVLGDREEFSRVISNLVKNSIQAAKHNNPEVDVTTTYSSDFVKILILDQGIGILPELLDKVTEPNFSTKTDGMGLGLAISKKIISDMRGSFNITSKVGEFTEITIMLPIFK